VTDEDVNFVDEVENLDELEMEELELDPEVPLTVFRPVPVNVLDQIEDIGFEAVDVNFNRIEFGGIDVDDRGVDVEKGDLGVTDDIQEDEEVA
jgi:hypothetical protein